VKGAGPAAPRRSKRLARRSGFCAAAHL